MKRKALFLSTLAVLTLGLTACGGGGGDKPAKETTIDLKVWCATEILDLTKSQLGSIPAISETTKLNITVEPMGEGDAAEKMITDVESGADVYCFAQDQLARLVAAGALAKVSSNFASSIKTRNDAGSVEAATVGSDLYAYPLTSDNGYFLYYDNSFFSADDVKDLSTMLTKAKAKTKTIAFNAGSAWYNAAFFFGAGATCEFKTNVNGDFVSYTDTYNSAAGLKAAKGMAELIKSGAYVDSSNAPEALGKDSVAVVSGTWDYAKAKELLGDKLGVAELPSFKVGNESFHLGSFAGYKLVGVKPQAKADRSYAAAYVAEYLTNKDNQLGRFKTNSWGPSNLEAQGTAEVKAAPALTALAAQNKHSKVQGQYPQAWWNVAGAIAGSINDLATVTDAGLQKILDTYHGQLDGMLSNAEE